MKIRIYKCAEALHTIDCECYFTQQELIDISWRAEDQLYALGLTPAQRSGAVVHCMSGGNIHSRLRALTRATLTRTSGGWWLTAVSCVNGWAGFEALYLTPGQDAAAIAHLRKGYRCL
jgi:hypothetical protein